MIDFNGFNWEPVRVIFTLAFDGFLLVGLLAFTCEMLAYFAKKHAEKK